MNLESVYENNYIPNEIWKLYSDDGIAKNHRRSHNERWISNLAGGKKARGI